MPSIRGKIALGYLSLALGVGGFVLFASANLRFLEKRVQEGVAISTFQETAQEMRRYEKNYFLYQAYDEAVSDLAAARSASHDLAKALDSPALQNVTQGDELASLRDSVQRYQSLINKPEPREAEVRAIGHDLSERSVRLAERERLIMVDTVRQSRNTLFLSVGVLVLLAIVGGQVVVRVVGRPLQQLEQQLEPLARGEFHSFQMASNDREMVSFTQALNRMLAELELRQKQVMQSDKLAALGTLASGVAHELNNPLGNISGAAQILLEEIGSLPPDTQAELRGWLQQIDDETERARLIVRTLLDYARHPAGTHGSIDLAQALDKCLLLLGAVLPDADSVRLELAPGLRVQADSSRMQQVFLNLIQNALHAGASRIHIKARAAQANDWPPQAGVVLGSPAPANAVLVRIHDNGEGIEPSHLQNVFDPFFTTRAPGEGTGLGLYIVSEILMEMGGAIAVSSQLGEGSCFSLWLPTEQPT